MLDSVATKVNLRRRGLTLDNHVYNVWVDGENCVGNLFFSYCKVITCVCNMWDR